MSEYWKPVNVAKGEFIHPHSLNCGLKWSEWNWEAEDGEPADVSPVWALIHKSWSATDDVRAISDYGGEKQLLGTRGPEDVSYDELLELKEIK